jgi:hypothetical protein
VLLIKYSHYWRDKVNEMRFAEHVEWTGEMRNASDIVAKNPKEGDNLWDLGS